MSSGLLQLVDEKRSLAGAVGLRHDVAHQRLRRSSRRVLNGDLRPRGGREHAARARHAARAGTAPPLAVALPPAPAAPGAPPAAGAPAAPGAPPAPAPARARLPSHAQLAADAWLSTDAWCARATARGSSSTRAARSAAARSGLAVRAAGSDGRERAQPFEHLSTAYALRGCINLRFTLRSHTLYSFDARSLRLGKIDSLAARTGSAHVRAIVVAIRAMHQATFRKWSLALRFARDR